MKNTIEIFALANESNIDAALLAVRDGDNYIIALDNDAGIDEEGWALIATFGEHPKTRIFQDNGRIKEQKFIQVLDNEAADVMVSKENSFFRTIKRALIGIPVYKGHGDLNDVDPKALGNTKEKIKLGVVDKIRKSAKGIEAHFALDNDGAEAVAAGWKFPSAFWLVLPNSKRDDAIVAKPFKLISVALTQFPNISGVESLANARSQFESGQKQNQEPDMKLIAGWLIAMGATSLANEADPKETQVLEAIKTVFASKAGEVTALGNEKQTLTGTISTLTTERDTQKRRAEEAAVALGNEQTARKADRKHAATAVVDLAIHKGILTVADREGQITALENSANFEADSKTLLAKTPGTKTTTNGTVESGKQNSGLSTEQVALQNDYDTAFKAELIEAGQDPVKAHKNIMTKPKYSALAARLVPQKS